MTGRVRGGRLAAVAVAALAAVVATLGGGTPALATTPTLSGSVQTTVPPVTGVRAYAAPDGVQVAFDPPPDGQYGGWEVERSTAGTTTVVAANLPLGFADTALPPGQEATYRVRALRGDEVGAWSAPATAARSTEGWTAAPGAHTVVFSSVDEPWAVFPQPLTQRDPVVRLAEQDLTDLSGTVVGRLPGPGTFALSRTPDAGEVFFAGQCSGTLVPPEHGTIVVHDVVYGAHGSPLTVAADLAWGCPDGGGTHRTVVRWVSAVPTAHVVVDPVDGEHTVVRGEGVGVDVVLRNTGDAPAHLGAVDAWMSQHQPVADQACAGVELAVGGTCTVHVTVVGAEDPATTGQRYLGVRAFVDDGPTVVGQASVRLYDRPTAPSLAVESSSPRLVTLLTRHDGVDMGPIRETRIQRQAADGTWTAIPETLDGVPASDVTVSPGEVVRYRAAYVLDSGQAPWSTTLEVAVPTQARVWALNGGVVASGSPDDLYGVFLPDTVQGYVTGVAAHPDRHHLLLETVVGSRPELVVTDLLGRNERIVQRSLPNRALYQPSVSPDGRRLVSWTGPSNPLVVVTDLATGATRSLGVAGQPVGWSPDGAKVLLGPGTDAGGASGRTGLAWVTVPEGTGASTVTVVDGTEAFTSPGVTLNARVSARGDIAWFDAVAKETRVLRSGAATSVLAAPEGCYGLPIWSPTGDRLAITKVNSWPCSWGAGSRSAPWPTTGVPDAQDWTRLGVPFEASSSSWLDATNTPPGVALSFATRTSGSPIVAFTVTDADDGPGAFTATCRVDTGPWVPCRSPFRPTGLATGSHHVDVRVTDPAGGVGSAQATWAVDATPPVVGGVALAASLVGTSTRLSWTATDSGGAGLTGFDVRSRSAGASGSFGSWTTLASVSSSTRSRTVTPRSGGTTCYLVRARDAVGNVGAWGPQRCVSTVVDDRSLARTGGVRTTSAGAWKGTLTRLAGTPTSLRLSSATTRRVGVVVRTCPTCGSLDVYLGSTRVGRVSTRSTSTVRRLLWLPSGSTRSASLTLRPASSTRVDVDGVVLLR